MSYILNLYQTRQCTIICCNKYDYLCAIFSHTLLLDHTSYFYKLKEAMCSNKNIMNYKYCQKQSRFLTVFCFLRALSAWHFITLSQGIFDHLCEWPWLQNSQVLDLEVVKLCFLIICSMISSMNGTVTWLGSYPVPSTSRVYRL